MVASTQAEGIGSHWHEPRNSESGACVHNSSETVVSTTVHTLSDITVISESTVNVKSTYSQAPVKEANVLGVSSKDVTIETNQSASLASSHLQAHAPATHGVEQYSGDYNTDTTSYSTMPHKTSLDRNQEGLHDDSFSASKQSFSPTWVEGNAEQPNGPSNWFEERGLSYPYTFPMMQFHYQNFVAPNMPFLPPVQMQPNRVSLATLMAMFGQQTDSIPAPNNLQPGSFPASGTQPSTTYFQSQPSTAYFQSQPSTTYLQSQPSPTYLQSQQLLQQPEGVVPCCPVVAPAGFPFMTPNCEQPVFPWTSQVTPASHQSVPPKHQEPIRQHCKSLPIIQHSGLKPNDSRSSLEEELQHILRPRSVTHPLDPPGRSPTPVLGPDSVRRGSLPQSETSAANSGGEFSLSHDTEQLRKRRSSSHSDVFSIVDTEPGDLTAAKLYESRLQKKKFSTLELKLDQIFGHPLHHHPASPLSPNSPTHFHGTGFHRSLGNLALCSDWDPLQENEPTHTQASSSRSTPPVLAADIIRNSKFTVGKTLIKHRYEPLSYSSRTWHGSEAIKLFKDIAKLLSQSYSHVYSLTTNKEISSKEDKKEDSAEKSTSADISRSQQSISSLDTSDGEQDDYLTASEGDPSSPVRSLTGWAKKEIPNLKFLDYLENESSEEEPLPHEGSSNRLHAAQKLRTQLNGKLRSISERSETGSEKANHASIKSVTRECDLVVDTENSVGKSPIQISPLLASSGALENLGSCPAKTVTAGGAISWSEHVALCRVCYMSCWLVAPFTLHLKEKKIIVINTV